MSRGVPLLALSTGIVAGAAFGLIGVSVPAPRELAGVIGIVGSFVGYRLVGSLGVGVDLLGVLGL